MEKEQSIENLDESNPAENSQVPINKQQVVDEEHYFGEEQETIQRRKPKQEEELVERDPINFDDDELDQNAKNYILNQYDHENKISGCLFGYIGIIVLGFAIFLIKQGRNSRRYQEIEEYVEDVAAWTGGFQQQFQKLNLDIITLAESKLDIPVMEGKETQEIDIAYALNRETRSEYEIKESLRNENLGSDFEPWVDSGRRLKGKNKMDDWVISYTPVKFQFEGTPSEAEKFFPSLFNTSYKEKGTLKIALEDPDNSRQELDFDIYLLKKHEIRTKNMQTCHGNALKPGNQVCINFYKLTTVCLIIGEESGQWSIKGNCGVTWDDMLHDSSEYVQEIDFHGYPMTIQIRSEHDPHVKFGLRTEGKFVLDGSPGGQIAAGVILLIFGIIMIMMSMYKTYRFLVKYTFKDYLRKKKEKKYLNEANDDELEFVNNRKVNKDQNKQEKS